MAKHLNVNLAFNADTSNAKKQIEALQMSLKKVAVGNSINVDDASLKAASAAAKELSLHLNNAYNAETGNFDLSKLDKSLKASKQNVNDLASSLLTAGESGQQAFVQLAQTIAAAERPMISINSKLREFATTLKNTARWQISSSILHGFMGALQEAYGYAQDLNESLNNIRIVTGYSAERMSDFAKEANAAAKALSTTTTEYTNASLIFYQQGLSDSEVAARTEVTIKMANAAGQSAEIVSDQLTAIWNNFYDGSDSLEHYADVMTALGAKTASSTDEIAGGLEKFAAVANTIGLSYEYAAAALATITSNTRQSEEVVGTALKTMFARIQGLNLGETLEDGTTLNKYSAALDKVGISIYDASGKLKDMDLILEEMATKWEDLGKAEQVALAQTVAGIRQYTQLVALMDNWNAGDSDSMVANLATANNADGALDQQADIYAESWEAARDRVSASAEAIYEQLLDDDFFISLANGFSSLLDSVKAFIDGIGGVKTILIAVSSFFLSSVAGKITPAIESLRHSFSIMFHGAQQQAEALSKQMNSSIEKALHASEKGTGPKFSTTDTVALQNAKELNTARSKLSVIEDKLTASQKQRYEQELAILKVYQDEAVAAAKLVDESKKAIAELSTSAIDYEGASKDLDRVRGNEENVLRTRRQAAADGEPMVEGDTAYNTTQKLNQHMAATDALRSAREAYVQAVYDSYAAEMQATNGAIEGSQKQIALQDLLGESLDEYEQKLMNVMNRGNDDTRRSRFAAIKQEIDLIVGDSVPALTQALNKAMDAKSPEVLKKRIAEVVAQLKAAKIPAADLERLLKQMGQGKNVSKISSRYKQLGKELENLKKKQKDANQAAADFKPEFKLDVLGRVTQLAAGLGQLAMSVQAVRSMFDAWNNDDLSFGEKLMTTFMGISMLVPSIIGSVKSLTSAFNLANAATIYHSSVMAGLSSTYGASTIAVVQKKLAMEGMTAAEKIAWVQQKLNISQTQAETVVDQIQAAGKNKVTLSVLAAAAAKWMENAADKGGVAGKVASIAATIAQTLANWGLNASMAPLLAITLLLTAAIAALVIAIVAVVAAVKAFQAAQPEAKLAAAKEEAAVLAEELNKAKEASDALRESIDKYDSAIKKIKTLEEGTREWREAIQEANDAAREVIEAADGSLSGKYSFNAETGLIEFDAGALDEAQDIMDNQVRIAQQQDLMGKNTVLQAQQAVDNKEFVGKNNKTYDNFENEVRDKYGIAAAAAVRARYISGISSTGGVGWSQQHGREIAEKLIIDPLETKALEELQDAYYETGGNMVEALDALGPINRNLIESLGYTDLELEELCQASMANTQAILENTKQIVDSEFAGNKDYENSANKEFLNEVLAGDVAAESERLYEEKYKDMFGGMTDADVQKEYAKLKGWDPNLVDNQNGNKAVYIDNDGNEVTLSDETVRRALAQEEALKNTEASIKSVSTNISELALKEKELALAADGSIKSYEKYKEAMHDYGKELGLTQSEIDSYIAKQGNMQTAANKSTLAKNLGSWTGYDDNWLLKGLNKKNSERIVEEFTKSLTDEQVELAVQVSAESSSFDDFKRNFEQALKESFITSIQSSSASTGEVLANAKSTGTFSASDMSVLEQDDNFVKFLEENGKKMVDFTYANYSEKYNIVAAYYADLRAAETAALEDSKENYQTDLAEYEAILDYKKAIEEGDKERARDIAGQWSHIDFTQYLDMDVSDIETKMDEVQNRINELDGQIIKLDMEWDTTEAIEDSLKSASEFTQLMSKDAKKVGDSYQLTAAQAKEWMQVYPDLFKTADVTTEGLIELNADQVEEYLGGQEDMTDATIQANIEKLESRLSELEAEKQAYIADLELAQMNASGRMELEGASAEYLAQTRQALTDYYIDLGLDETAANAAALDTMGLNQEEYSGLVAEASKTNAENQIASSEVGAKGLLTVLKQSWENFKEWARKVGDLIANVWRAIWDKDYTLSDAWGEFNEGKISADADTSKISAYDANGNFKEGFESQRTAALRKVNDQNVLDLESKIAGIDERMNNIRAEIVYNKALMNQDLSDYGSTDPDSYNTAVDPEDLIDIAERYHEITREIESLNHQLELAANATDRAFGKDKVAKMKEEQAALKALYDRQADLYQLQLAYLAIDAGNLNDASVEGHFDTQATFDEYGNISNYSALLQEAETKYNAAQRTFAASNQSESDEEVLEKAEAEYEARIALLEQYEETLDSTNEQALTLQDTFNSIQDKKFEELSTTMELNVEVNDSQLEEIEYYLDKYADNFYKMAESAALIGSQMAISEDAIAIQKDYMAQLDAAKAAGEISDADYGEGRDGVIASLREQAVSLAELDKEMQAYYGNTLSMAQEEIGKYTSRMDHLSSVLDHYQSMMSIIGKETDYKSMGVVLQGIADNMANQVAVAEKEYEFYKGEADRKKKLMDAAIDDPAAFEAYKKEWEAAEAAAQEAQDNMLSKTEEWAESMKSVIQNKLSDFAKDLEASLTGGTSFDEMTTSIERAASLQEEYLTTTNQVYETTKMMRTAQKALDEAVSVGAKNKLKGFIEETKQLQAQGKLSQYELDTQQAKYDLLVAQIALEEAQNAKSTVRLQRDSEGNFGYVYTADANQVAEAQQGVDDAENALYNKALEGANDYVQKYQSTMAEAQDAVTALTQAFYDGEIASQEEYNRRMEETTAYYQEKLSGYAQLYQTAVSTDSSVLKEAWSTSFADLTTQTEDWAASVKNYSNQCGEAFKEWDAVVAEVEETVGGSFEEIAENVSDITTESTNLKDELLGDEGVIAALDTEVDAVSAATEAYAKKRASIQETITELEKYIATLQAAANAEKGDFSTTTTTTTTTTTGNTEDVPGMATGGYTGVWGPEGKLAVLHEKELVLNASDTSNILQAVEMVRTILQAIDMHSMSAQLGGILATPGFYGGESQPLEQNVKIEAQFPNVQDRNEIEEAFNNLINKASQYANR